MNRIWPRDFSRPLDLDLPPVADDERKKLEPFGRERFKRSEVHELLDLLHRSLMSLRFAASWRTARSTVPADRAETPDHRVAEFFEGVVKPPMPSSHV